MTNWVLTYLAIAVAGLAMVGCFAVWLWRKAMALLDEAGGLLQRADELASLVGEIGVIADLSDPQDIHSRRADGEMTWAEEGLLARKGDVG